MKLSKRTVEILKSFATVNQSIYVAEGDTSLGTVAISKAIMGRVDIDEEFPKEFGLYDINEFLAAMSLFTDPELTFEENYVKISQDNSNITYRYCEKELVVSPPPLDKVKMPEVDITVKVSGDNLGTAVKAASILSLPDVTFYTEDGKVFLGVSNKAKTNSSNSWSQEIGEYAGEDDFSAVIKVDSLKMLPYDYVVELSSGGLTKWTCKDEGAQYFIPMAPVS